MYNVVWAGPSGSEEPVYSNPLPPSLQPEEYEDDDGYVLSQSEILLDGGIWLGLGAVPLIFF